MYCPDFPLRFAKEEENQRGPKRDFQKHSICKFCGVNFTSGGERASFETPFSPVGQIREESVKWVQLNTVRDICHSLFGHSTFLVSSLAYLLTLPVFPGVSKFFIKSPGLPVRAPNLPETSYRGSFYISYLLN